MYWNLVTTICLGFVGGALGRKIHIPGGVMIGAMLFASMGNLLSMSAVSLPPFYSFGLQVSTGCLVGISLTKQMLFGLKKMTAPVMVSAAIILGGGICVTIIIYHLFHWEMVSAWLASSPGRMQDMVILADSFRANTTQVAIAHVFRSVSVVILTPIVISIHGRVLMEQKLMEIRKNKEEN